MLAKAHAKLARLCGVKLPSLGTAASAMMANASGDSYPIVARAHATTGSSRAPNSSGRSASCSATASKKVLETTPMLVADQTSDEMASVLNSPSLVSASARIASNRPAGVRPKVENAHAVLTRPCGLKLGSLARTSTASADVSSSGAFPWIARDHTTLVSPCSLNSCSRPCASLASVSNSTGASWPVVAKAQSRLDVSCALNCAARRVMMGASASKSAGAWCPAVA
mmetsp:Transcript_7856/g.17340  ORF Transcript_7856/g.17340 Transcript_7856/m.17340 type:complete len:226 (+) Transcript_7856:1956-2633(+)